MTNLTTKQTETNQARTEKITLIADILKAFEVKQISDLTTYAKRWTKAEEILDKYLENHL